MLPDQGKQAEKKGFAAKPSPTLSPPLNDLASASAPSPVSTIVRQYSDRRGAKFPVMYPPQKSSDMSSDFVSDGGPSGYLEMPQPRNTVTSIGTVGTVLRIQSEGLSSPAESRRVASPRIVTIQKLQTVVKTIKDMIEGFPSLDEVPEKILVLYLAITELLQKTQASGLTYSNLKEEKLTKSVKDLILSPRPSPASPSRIESNPAVSVRSLDGPSKVSTARSDVTLPRALSDATSTSGWGTSRRISMRKVKTVRDTLKHVLACQPSAASSEEKDGDEPLGETNAIQTMLDTLDKLVEKTGGSVKVQDVPLETLRDLLVSPRSEAPTTPHEQRKMEVRTIRHAFRQYMAHDPEYVNPGGRPASNRVAEPKEEKRATSHLGGGLQPPGRRQKSGGRGPVKQRPHGSIRILGTSDALPENQSVDYDRTDTLGSVLTASTPFLPDLPSPSNKSSNKSNQSAAKCPSQGGVKFLPSPAPSDPTVKVVAPTTPKDGASDHQESLGHGSTLPSLPGVDTRSDPTPAVKKLPPNAQLSARRTASQPVTDKEKRNSDLPTVNDARPSSGSCCIVM